MELEHKLAEEKTKHRKTRQRRWGLYRRLKWAQRDMRALEKRADPRMSKLRERIKWLQDVAKDAQESNRELMRGLAARDSSASKLAESHGIKFKKLKQLISRTEGKLRFDSWAKEPIWLPAARFAVAYFEQEGR